MVKKIINHLFLTAISMATLFISCQEIQPVKPNMIFLFVDDLSYNAVHAHGNPDIYTPNLDKLAAEGISFTHAYNMGAWHGAVCIASRTMLNTGRSLWRAWGCEQTGMKELVSQGQFWSQLMQDAGYETYFSGKWHVMHVKPEEVFDHVKHVRPGMPKTVEESYNRPIKGQPDLWSPYDTAIGGFWEGGQHWSEVLADDAIEYIQQAGQKDNPFFMYLAFNAPHDPRQSPCEYVEMYPLENMKVPESFLKEYPYKDHIGCGENLRDENLAPFPRTEYAVQVHQQEYYAIISHLDAQIGRILEALHHSGSADNTYIFFTADHGLACGHHGLMGKQNMYDHSIRPPLMVVGPDVPKNERREMDIYLQDIMPTAIELAGVKIPDYVEFNSLLPLITGVNQKGHYKAIYGCYMDFQRMIRKDQYKLIAYPKPGIIRLYDLESDPLELNDIAEDPVYADKIGEMFHQLEELSKKMGDTLKLREFFPNL